MKLAIPYVFIYTVTNYFTRLWAFRWREAMTFSYMPYWRAVDAKVEGASQRIQEDAMNFAKIVESLGLQVVRAIMLLIAFLPILMALSTYVQQKMMSGGIQQPQQKMMQNFMMVFFFLIFNNFIYPLVHINVSRKVSFNYWHNLDCFVLTANRITFLDISVV